jgi:hypothetical protein
MRKTYLAIASFEGRRQELWAISNSWIKKENGFSPTAPRIDYGPVGTLILGQ